MQEELSYLLSNGLITDSELTQLRNGTASSELNRSLVWFICGREYASLKKHYGSYDEIPLQEEVVSLRLISDKISSLDDSVRNQIQESSEEITSLINTHQSNTVSSINSLALTQSESVQALSGAVDGVSMSVSKLDQKLRATNDSLGSLQEILQKRHEDLILHVSGSNNDQTEILQSKIDSVKQDIMDSSTTFHDDIKDRISSVLQTLDGFSVLLSDTKTSLLNSFGELCGEVSVMCSTSASASETTKSKVQEFLFNVSTLHEITSALYDKVSLAYANWVQIAAENANVKLDMSNLALDLGPFVEKITNATVQISHFFDTLPSLTLSLGLIKDNQERYDELLAMLNSVDKRLGVVSLIESVKNASDVVTNIADLVSPKEVKNGLLS